MCGWCFLSWIIRKNKRRIENKAFPIRAQQFYAHAHLSLLLDFLPRSECEAKIFGIRNVKQTLCRSAVKNSDNKFGDSQFKTLHIVVPVPVLICRLHKNVSYNKNLFMVYWHTTLTLSHNFDFLLIRWHTHTQHLHAWNAIRRTLRLCVESPRSLTKKELWI